MYLFQQKGIVQKMVISTASLMIVIAGYNIIKSTVQRYFHFDKQRSLKNRMLRQDNSKVYPALHNPRCQTIGKVTKLAIYPVKSSKKALFYELCEFRDYGMCTAYGRCFWDGMFIVYNRTKGKFEDSRRYPLLQSMLAKQSDAVKVTLHQMSVRCRTVNQVQLDMYRCRNPSNRFVKEIWSGTLEAYYSSDEEVNTWVKNAIEANQINGADEDVILAHMLPRNWDSTQAIKENWYRFVQGYDTMDEDETGKFITLPRFVLMTSQTFEELRRQNIFVTPNIIVTPGNSMNPFEEKCWNWIRLGGDVILKNLKPIPSNDKRFEHYGIYCGLWSGGYVKVGDEVLHSLHNTLF